MEYRKLIGFGKSSYVVSLPITWVNKNKLQKGDLISVDESDFNLVLSPQKYNKPEVLSSIIINVSNKSFNRIKREIVSAYISNFHNIKLIGHDLVEKSSDIRSILNELMALEIMEITSEYIVTKDFLNMNKISIENLVRKIDVIIKSMISDIVDMHVGGDVVEIEKRSEDVNKLILLSYRFIKYVYNNPLDAKNFRLGYVELLNSYILVQNLKSFSSHIKRVSRYLNKTKLNKGEFKEIIDVLKKINDNYHLVMKAYYLKNVKLAHEIADMRLEMIKLCEDIYEKHYSIKYLGYITGEFKRAIVSIQNISRTVYD